MRKEVVHVETQEQYDYVNEKLNYNWHENKWLDERENTCLRTDEREYSSFNYYKHNEKAIIISFNEFKSRYEPQLKIGDTFEHNGFVCEAKEEINKWYKIEDNKNNKVAFEKLYKQDVLDIEKLPYAKLTEITNKEFIKQLEENAR